MPGRVCRFHEELPDNQCPVCVTQGKMSAEIARLAAEVEHWRSMSDDARDEGVRIRADRSAALARAEKAEAEVERLTRELDGCPEWCCAECGSINLRGIVYPSTPNGPEEYDMECNECGSLEIAESGTEAARVLAEKLDTARAERDAALAREQVLREAAAKAREMHDKDDPVGRCTCYACRVLSCALLREKGGE